MINFHHDKQRSLWPSDGNVLLPNGNVRLPNGNILTPDGSLILPDGRCATVAGILALSVCISKSIQQSSLLTKHTKQMGSKKKDPLFK